MPIDIKTYYKHGGRKMKKIFLRVQIIYLVLKLSRKVERKSLLNYLEILNRYLSIHSIEIARSITERDVYAYIAYYEAIAMPNLELELMEAYNAFIDKESVSLISKLTYKLKRIYECDIEKILESAI